MTPLRHHLDRAKSAHERTRYPGSLALDVLGPAEPAATTRPWRSGLAIAAALAVGLGVGAIAGRATRVDPPPVAVELPSTRPAEMNTETNTETSVAVVEPTAVEGATGDATGDGARAEESFAAAPFAGGSSSIVPDLTALASVGTTDDVTATSAPMSLMLLSVDEYAEQAAATTTDN